MSILQKVLDRRAESVSDTIADAVQQRYGTNGPLIVSADRALQHTAVFACVRLIAEGIAALPAHTYRRDGTARVQLPTQPKLMEQPHRDLTVFEWRRQLLTSMLLRGNAFGLVVERDRLGYPTQLTPIDPDTVSVDARNGRWEWRIRNEPVDLYSDGGPLVHFPGFQTAGRPLGLSPIALAAAAVGVGLEAERFAANWFRDGAAPSSILSTEEELDDVEARKQQAKWAAAHGSGSRFPAVLSGGMTWTPVTISPEESQFLETQKFSVSQIARAFGVPPHMIGDVTTSTSWGSGIEQQHIGYITHTLMPWIQALDGRMTTLVPRGQYVRTNTAAMLRADFKTRSTGYSQARMAGWLSVNDIRAYEELPPIEGEGGDDYLQPLNMAPLGTDPYGSPGEPPPDDSEPPDDNSNVAD